MANRVINTILNLKDNFSKGISSATSSTKTFQKQLKQAEMQGAKLQKTVSNSVAGIAGKVAGVAGAIGLTAFAKDSLMLASDLAEVQNVVDVTFGDKLTGAINDFAKTTTTQFGVSELQAKRYCGVLGAIMKSSGLSGDSLKDMSIKLAGLAGDMASFYNLEPDVAFEKLKSAISGETEPMKALGVNMSVANMEAYALTQGIKKQWKAMSQAEQTTLRYKYLMEHTKDAQGDYAKTCKQFANILRTLKLNVQTFGAKIMAHTIPALQNFFDWLNNIIVNIDVDKWVAKLVNQFDYFKNKLSYCLPAIAGVASALGSFLIISKISSMVSNFVGAIKGISMLSTLANPVVLVALAIGAVVAACVYFYKTSDSFKDSVDGMYGKLQEFGAWLSTTLQPLFDYLSNWFTNSIIPIFQELGSKLCESWQNIQPTLSTLYNNLMIIWTNVLMPLEAFIAGVFVVQWTTAFETICNVVSSVVERFTGIIAGIIEAFTGLTDFIVGVFTGNWEQAWNGIKEIFTGIFDGLKASVEGTMNVIIDLINGAINGMNNMASIDLPLVGKIGLDIPNIPKFATGTSYFSGGLATINERGGELVNLPNGSQVVPADKTDRLLGGKSNVNVNVNVQGNVVGNDDFVHYMGSQITQQIMLALGNN